MNPPFGIGGLFWEPDEVEAKTVWQLYIELVTRVATLDLARPRLDREVLKSLYSLFPATRRVARGWAQGGELRPAP